MGRKVGRYMCGMMGGWMGRKRGSNVGRSVQG